MRSVSHARFDPIGDGMKGCMRGSPKKIKFEMRSILPVFAATRRCLRFLVFLFVRHRGLSRLSGQWMVAMLGGSRPNPFCECAIVVDHQKLHTACVISLGTPPLRRELGSLVRGSRIFQGGLLLLWGS